MWGGTVLWNYRSMQLLQSQFPYFSQFDFKLVFYWKVALNISKQCMGFQPDSNGMELPWTDTSIGYFSSSEEEVVDDVLRSSTSPHKTARRNEDANAIETMVDVIKTLSTFQKNIHVIKSKVVQLDQGKKYAEMCMIKKVRADRLITLLARKPKYFTIRTGSNGKVRRTFISILSKHMQTEY